MAEMTSSISLSYIMMYTITHLFLHGGNVPEQIIPIYIITHLFLHGGNDLEHIIVIDRETRLLGESASRLCCRELVAVFCSVACCFWLCVYVCVCVLRVVG